MIGRHVALLRGVNVGRAKRVAMVDLRALVAGLGYADVRTLLNSGNVVFSAPGATGETAAARIEASLVERLGLAARVVVLSAGELAEAVRDNPLLELATDPSRLLVAFLADPRDRARLLPLAERDWSPEALAIGCRVAYLWCSDGVTAGRVSTEVERAVGGAVTARNWTTTTRLLEMVRTSSG
jgi:uncharacterized protein (DUF1697 family)